MSCGSVGSLAFGAVSGCAQTRDFCHPAAESRAPSVAEHSTSATGGRHPQPGGLGMRGEGVVRRFISGHLSLGETLVSRKHRPLPNQARTQPPARREPRTPRGTPAPAAADCTSEEPDKLSPVRRLAFHFRRGPSAPVWPLADTPATVTTQSGARGTGRDG